MEVVVGCDRHRMQTRQDGWFAAEVAVDAGADYKFSVDSGDPLPDPRSLHQPFGIHGVSRVVDHSAFKWSVNQWQAIDPADAVFYEMHVGTFTPEGTFDAAAGRLDHLAALGVNVVELMPVGEFSGSRGWGYDSVDLFAPHHCYGGPDGLKRLIDACHARGLAVVMDVVYNHLGPSGNYLELFGPYFTARYGTPWGKAINFDDAHSDQVRGFFLDNARMWLEDYRCDGLRLDAIHAIFDMSATHILEEIAAQARRLEQQLRRPLFIVAESDLNDPRIVTDPSTGGLGIDAQWSDDLHHAIHAYLTGEREGYYGDFGQIAHIAKALEDAFVYDGIYSAFRKRIHGRSAAGLPGHRFLGYIQNHDQVGNRAKGERLSHLVPPALAKVAAALVFTGPCVPMVFQGEEWGATTPFLYFTDHAEAELAAAVTEGRRREFSAFGWDPDEIPDPQAFETFAASKLKWDETLRDAAAEMLRWYGRLITLRRSHKELRDGQLGKVQVTFEEKEGRLKMRRGDLEVMCNFADREAAVQTAAGKILLASDDETRLSEGLLKLPAESVAVVAPAES